MAKCKPEHMHIPHDSRPEGKRAKRSNTVRYCELQSSRTLTPPQGPCSSFCRERLQGRRSVRNLHHGTTGKRTTQKLVPEGKWQEKFSEFFENLFMQKDDDFLKSPVEAPVHRKVLLEDKDISPKTHKAFDKLCERYDDIISKNSGDIGKTMLVEMEIDT